MSRILLISYSNCIYIYIQLTGSGLIGANIQSVVRLVEEENKTEIDRAIIQNHNMAGEIALDKKWISEIAVKILVLVSSLQSLS